MTRASMYVTQPGSCTPTPYDLCPSSSLMKRRCCLTSWECVILESQRGSGEARMEAQTELSTTLWTRTKTVDSRAQERQR